MENGAASEAMAGECPQTAHFPLLKLESTIWFPFNRHCTAYRDGIKAPLFRQRLGSSSLPWEIRQQSRAKEEIGSPWKIYEEQEHKGKRQKTLRIEGNKIIHFLLPQVR